MTACPDATQLALLAEGALADRGAVEHHLDDCAACSELVAELARLVAPAQPAPERYQIIRQLGAGAMGVVWEAEDRQLRRRVALKWIRPGDDDGRRRARLLREARALAQLRHPNVVAVHDVGEAGDQLYLALELFSGTTARVWRSSARSPAEILALWRQVGAGLIAVHRAGIVHRDVKPDNVLVDHDGRVAVGDFGLATGELDELATTLTLSGQVIGTPVYMAPEQLRGEPATARSDQYAFCVCVWEALAGARPFRADTIAGLALAMVRRPALPPGQDRRVFAVLARGLDPDPAKRWPDLARLGAALDAPVPRRKLIAPALATLAMVGACVVLWAAHDPDPAPAPGSPPAPPAPPAAGLAAAPHVDVGDAPVRAPDPAVPLLVAAVTPPVTTEVHAATPPGTTTKANVTRPPAASKANAAPPPATTKANAAPPLATTTAKASAAPPSATTKEIAAPPPAATEAGPRAGARPAVAVQPSSVVDPQPMASWHRALERAQDLLRARDGAQCLATLASSPPIPADQLPLATAVHADCTMLAGACEVGRNELVAAGLGAAAVDTHDERWCLLDAPPRARWPRRATVQLGTASVNGGCGPVLAKIDALGIELPDRKLFDIYRIQCLIHEGDCDAARALWRQTSGLPAEAAGDDAFAHTFRACGTPRRGH